MNKKTVRVGIVGSGNIANVYAKNIARYPHCALAGFQDIDPARAEKLAKEYGVKAYKTIEEVVADPDVDMVVNLTFQTAHAAVARQCLEAGKHVFTEKPLALTYKEARELVELADKRGLRVSSAPITYMGEAQAAAWRTLREDKIGAVRMVYCEVNCGRLEKWHPNPGPFFDVGPVWDVGVYPLTLLTAFFGPAKKVSAFARKIFPERVSKEGKALAVKAPDFYVAFVEFANGACARYTINFCFNSRQGVGLEFFGDNGILTLDNFQDFRTKVELKVTDKEPQIVDTGVPVRMTPTYGRAGRGVDEMAKAILEGRPQMASGAHAAHVTEIMEAIDKSNGQAIEIKSTFPALTPADTQTFSRYEED